MSGFVNVATLEAHQDEVWNLEWSHDGLFLATASKDKSVIIWRVESILERGQESHRFTIYARFSDHPYAVSSLAWSLDDSIFLSNSENIIKMWNVKTSTCICTLDSHTDAVAALSWLSDGSGFISGDLDRKIIHWSSDGKVREDWGLIAIRITGLSVTPDSTRLVAIGIGYQAIVANQGDGAGPQSRTQRTDVSLCGGGGGGGPDLSKGENGIIVFDLATKQTLLSIRLEGEITSVKLSQNSQYALINHAPDMLHLYDIRNGRLCGKYVGQKQGWHIIRSCYGGVGETLVISGSEDSKVYVWDRKTSALLEVLSGHGEGSVNSVAWNPRNERLFASCSDDRTVRIWEAPPL